MGNHGKCPLTVAKIFQVLIQISFYLVLKNIGIGGFAETDTEPKHTLTDTEYSAAETGIGRSLVWTGKAPNAQHWIPSDNQNSLMLNFLFILLDQTLSKMAKYDPNRPNSLMVGTNPYMSSTNFTGGGPEKRRF